VENDLGCGEFRLDLLSIVCDGIRKRALREILDLLHIAFPPDATLRRLCTLLKIFICKEAKGKHSQRETIPDVWLRTLSESTKDKLVSAFRNETGLAALSCFTCACCAESCPQADQKIMPASEVPVVLLRLSTENDNAQMSSGVTLCSHNQLTGCCLDEAGIVTDDDNEIILTLCGQCHSSLAHHKMPPLALANNLLLGKIPDELKDLTAIEEAMIARCRSKCWIVQLKESNHDMSMPNAQRGMKGHIIIYPQRPGELYSVLPPSMTDLITPVCVIFVGSSPPSEAWLRNKAKPLVIRREKVRSALFWLKQHNELYADIEINNGMLNSLQDEQLLPVHVEHVLPSTATDGITSQYDGAESIVPTNVQANPGPLFEQVVITDVDGHAPANELRAAAICHAKDKSVGFIQMPHDPKPMNEFCNPSLFPMIYPTLFPYGRGGFDDHQRLARLSMRRQVKHFFNLADRRFQEHYSFLFTAFNVLQRREVLLHSSLKIKHATFDSVANDFATVSAEAIH